MSDRIEAWWWIARHPFKAAAIRRYVADEEVRSMTATPDATIDTVTPLVEEKTREQVAREIEANVVPGAVTRDYRIGNDAYEHAARIARGHG